MYKEIPEDLIMAKAKELPVNDVWRKEVCLLILLLLLQGELASKYFIFKKMEEWGLLKLFFIKRINSVMRNEEDILEAISRTLLNLFENGYLRKEDLARKSLHEKGFEEICEKRVLGRPKQKNPRSPHRWIQSAYKLSPKGRKLAKSILFPPKKKRAFCNPIRRKPGGGQNCACA